MLRSEFLLAYCRMSMMFFMLVASLFYLLKLFYAWEWSGWLPVGIALACATWTLQRGQSKYAEETAAIREENKMIGGDKL